MTTNPSWLRNDMANSTITSYGPWQTNTNSTTTTIPLAGQTIYRAGGQVVMSPGAYAKFTKMLNTPAAQEQLDTHQHLDDCAEPSS